jgi:type 1 fimbria pilin
MAAAASAIASRRWRGLLFACALLLGLVAMPRSAQATCWYTSGSAATVTFNAGTITLTPSTQLGSVLWTSNTATPPNPPVLDCDGNTAGGIFNIIAASTPVNGDNTLMPTGIPGISYRLLHPDPSTLLALYPNYPTGSGTFSVPSNLQLVYTGPYLPPNNSTLTGQLAQWKIDICNGSWTFNWGSWSYYCKGGTVAPRPVETFNINAIINIQVPTCDVDPGSKDKIVTLPTITGAQLGSKSSTAGKTPFSLKLVNCPNKQNIFLTLSTSSPQAGATGVIAPTSGSGYATGVGVQVLQSDGSSAFPFNTPLQVGTASASTYNINLFAQYYQTGNSAGAGSVKAIATYTLNYQ